MTRFLLNCLLVVLNVSTLSQALAKEGDSTLVEECTIGVNILLEYSNHTWLVCVILMETLDFFNSVKSIV